MPNFFSVALLTVVVVAGIAAVGWMRSRSLQSKDASNKKHDKEVMTDSNIEIVVSIDKQSLNGTTTLSDDVSNQNHQTIASIGSSLSNKLSLELVNRRQYVKAVCDRFETWSADSLHSLLADGHEGATVTPVPVNSQETSSSGNATTAFRTKPKPNNLSSFVRQCVSNIERSAFASNALPVRTISPRTSIASNQCDSPPKFSMIEEQRVPSLVVATDCDSTTSQLCEIVDDNIPLQSDGMTKLVLHRVPSSKLPLPMPVTRSFKATKAPTHAPSAAVAIKPVPSISLPLVSTLVVKPETVLQMEPSVNKSNETDPVDIDGERVYKEEPFRSPESPEESQPQSMPPLTRKTSNGASRLLQFQQRVPSNQARTPTVAQ